MNKSLSNPTLSLPTPLYDLDATCTASGSTVYPPSEDTFLLMDALERDRDILRSLDLALVVEIGSGSGVVSAFVACTFYFYEFPKNDFIQQSLLSSANSAISRVFNARVSTSRSSFFSLCTDLNPAASNCSQDTAQRNDVHCKTGAIICNLLDPLRLRHSIDLLIFNPPYVPTAPDEADIINFPLLDDPLALCYAGGSNGRSTVDSLLGQIPDLLSPKGLFYLVALHQNKIEELRTSARECHRLESEIVAKRRCGIELLYILRFSKIIKD